MRWDINWRINPWHNFNFPLCSNNHTMKSEILRASLVPRVSPHFLRREPGDEATQGLAPQVLLSNSDSSRAWITFLLWLGVSTRQAGTSHKMLYTIKPHNYGFCCCTRRMVVHWTPTLFYTPQVSSQSLLPFRVMSPTHLSSLPPEAVAHGQDLSNTKHRKWHKM